MLMISTAPLILITGLCSGFISNPRDQISPTQEIAGLFGVNGDIQVGFKERVHDM
jgi:hypothetical protein